jgi:hypothetical protein
MLAEPKVPNTELLQAGLSLMEQAGSPLKRIESKGRSMIYRTPDGQTVRVRTCNDHVLVTLADSPSPQAALNIEGTDRLLIVMPETPRARGFIVAYLVPTEVAVQAVRETHEDWLASNPKTKGENRTWNIWFDDSGPAKASGFARKWAEYRLAGSVDVSKPTQSRNAPKPSGAPNVLEVIADSRRQIASAARVPESAVKITIDFT